MFSSVLMTVHDIGTALAPHVDWSWYILQTLYPFMYTSEVSKFLGLCYIRGKARCFTHFSSNHLGNGKCGDSRKHLELLGSSEFPVFIKEIIS